MHLRSKPIQAPGSAVPARAAAPAGFAALCLALGALLAVKYLPLRPTPFVLSQYLWTPAVGDYRRAVLSSVAALAWSGDPVRFLPVVDAISALEIAGLALALAWAASRFAGRPALRLALLLALCSGASSHLIATRGSQDGFVALAVVGLAATLGSGRSRGTAGWATASAAVLGALAVAIHEGAVFYVASVCALNVLLADADADPGAGWRRTLARLAAPAARPALAGFAAAVAALAVTMLATHMAPDAIADICRRQAWIGTAGGTDVIHRPDALEGAEGWSEVCGLQFGRFSGSLPYVLRSVGVGALFAPVVMVALVLVARARLPLRLRAGAIAALMVPALLPFVATDTTRAWSYMNLTALYALALAFPHLRGFGRVSPRLLVGAVLALWVVVAVGIDQWPTGWPQMPRLLPDAAVMRMPTFREALCSAMRDGMCYRPTVRAQ